MYRDHWVLMIAILAVASMTVGNLGALLQSDVKRLLAYSSIAHAGYMLVAFTASQHEAVSTICFYTAAYAAMNVGAFLVLTQLSGFDEKLRTLDDLTASPSSARALGNFWLFSSIPHRNPFTGGFFGKFYVFSAAVHGGYTWLAIVGLANSGVACFYYLRVLAAIYSRPSTDTLADTPTPRNVTLPAALALAATAAATLFLGILPNHVLHLTQRATPTTIAQTTAAPPRPQ